jgi:hypothetical protein
MIAPLDLDAIKARVEAATPGPWEVVDYNRGNRERDTWLGVIRGAFEVIGGAVQIGRIKYSALTHRENVANAKFIAHSREDVDELVKEVERLRKDEARLDWLENTEAGLTCWNVREDGGSPDNGWTVDVRHDRDDELDPADDDPAGDTARDAIDWAMKLAARTPAISEAGDGISGLVTRCQRLGHRWHARHRECNWCGAPRP